MNGFLNIHKPAGLTSHDVVAKVRRLLGVQRVGHTGTLDPAATGVLPICIGKATKVAQFFLETDKEYRVVMRLGEVTDTEDATGKVLSRRPIASLTHEKIQKTVEGFQGLQWQIAPMYSAVKVGGEPLYKAARQGRQVERPTRRVIVHRINVLGIEVRDRDDIIDVTFDVTCSKGTYVRTLCADIGEKLGVGGHLLRLERRRSGPFHIDKAIHLSEVQQRTAEGSIGEKLIPMEEVLSSYPSLRVTPEAERFVLHGAPIGAREITYFPMEFKTGKAVLVYNAAGELVALASALIDRDQMAGVGRAAPVFKINKVLV
ncbi:MAG TPA: tRNA pseudouridine(55) synthase TruB [Nitrospiria bacterium]|nr:tRNA pseudouridine(55) synthase TruB [Nitrospiria bacterium]